MAGYDVKEDADLGERTELRLWFRADIGTRECTISVMVRGQKENVTPSMQSWDGDAEKTYEHTIAIPRADCSFARAFAQDGTCDVEVTWVKVSDPEGEESKERAIGRLHMQHLLVNASEISSRIEGDGFSLLFGTSSDILTHDVRAFLLPCVLDAQVKTGADETHVESITFPGGPTKVYAGAPVVFFIGTWDMHLTRANLQTHRCRVQVHEGEASFLLCDLLRIKRWADKQDIIPALPPAKNLCTSWEIGLLFDDRAACTERQKPKEHTHAQKYLDNHTMVRLSVDCFTSLGRQADASSEPFGRIVVVMSGGRRKLATISQRMLNVAHLHNVAALDMGACASQAMATRQMTASEKEDPTLDVITGFCANIDPSKGTRILCFEGIRSPAFSDFVVVLRDIGRRLKGKNMVYTVLHHAEIGFDRRMYAEFDFVVKEIKLGQSLDSLLSHPGFFDAHITPIEVRRGLHQLYDLRQSARLALCKVQQSFPSAGDLVVIEMTCGTFILDSKEEAQKSQSRRGGSSPSSPSQSPSQSPRRLGSECDSRSACISRRASHFRMICTPTSRQLSPSSDGGSSVPTEESKPGKHPVNKVDCHNHAYTKHLSRPRLSLNCIRRNVDYVQSLSARSRQKTVIDTESGMLPDVLNPETTITKQLRTKMSLQRTVVEAAPQELRRNVPEFRYPCPKKPGEFTKPNKDVSSVRKEDLREPWVEEKEPYPKGKVIKGAFDASSLTLTPRVVEVARHLPCTLPEQKKMALEELDNWRQKLVVGSATMSFPKSGQPEDALLQDRPYKLGLRFTARTGGATAEIEPTVKPLCHGTPFIDYRLNSTLVTPFARLVLRPSTKRDVMVHETPRNKRWITALSSEDRLRFPPFSARESVKPRDQLVRLTAR